MPTPSPSYTPSPSRLGATDYGDIFVAAIEGGINYWAAVDDYEFSFAKNPSDDDFAKARIIEEESQDSWMIDSRSATWHNAVQAAADYFGQNIYDFMEDHDAGSADVAMQFAIFGEVIYG